jgi:DNA gyrase subunit B
MARDEIRSLSTREQCRMRLPVFFGSVDNYIHGYREVIANGIDEITNNFENGTINIELFEDNQTISVEDTGRGVPILNNDGETGNEILLFETLFSGTNFENEENGKETTGTNGSGTCVLNHTSELFRVEVNKDNKYIDLKYTDGGLNKDLQISDYEHDKHGSKFTFKLDNTVYPNITYDFEEIKEIVRHCSATSNEITFNLKYKDTIEKFKYDTLEDYFDSITNQLTSKKIIIPMKSFDNELKTTYKDGEQVIVKEHDSLRLIVSTSPNTIQEAYLNHNYLSEGGTINEGVLDGFKNIINDYCKKNKLFNKKIKVISREDVQSSLCFIVDFRTNNVEYTNQTKYATKKLLFGRITREYIADFLEAYSIENESDFALLVKHVLQIADFNNQNTKLKDELKKKLSQNVSGMLNKIEDLFDCEVHDENSEFYICEGKSSGGGLVKARNSLCHAIYSLRGKILNCLKNSDKSIFENEVIIELIRTLGCGIEIKSKILDGIGKFDIKKLRYGKIVIATDMDFDGYAICVLILTMIYKLMPSLLLEEKIYIAMTPLFVLKYKENGEEKRIYAYDDNEKDKYLKEMNNKKVTVGRIKGLGELDPNDLYVTALNPETRHMIKVTIDDAKKMGELFDLWMSDKVAPRKEHIQKRLPEYLDDEE